MADLNRVTLIGRLTRDAELKYTSSSMPVCRFSIALNKIRKSGEQRTEEAHFFDIVLWGRAAESLHKYLVKGKQVAIDGELRQDRWEQDGQQRSRVEIVAQNVQLLGRDMDSSASSGASGGYAPRQPYSQQAGGGQQAPQAQEPRGYQGQDAEFPDDIPDDVPF